MVSIEERTFVMAPMVGVQFDKTHFASILQQLSSNLVINDVD